MKVVYNNCFGGFGLSRLATLEYAKRKGITLTLYMRDYSADTYTKLEESYATSVDSWSIVYSTEDEGDNPEKLKGYYYPEYDRHDPDLVAVVEELGEKANGECANLAIEEIPDGAEYEIDDYDGNESVVPPRPSW